MLFPVVTRRRHDGTFERVDLREEAYRPALNSARDYEWACAVKRAELHGGKPEDYVSWVSPGVR